MPLCYAALMVPRTPLILIGGGGHALVVDEAAALEGYERAGYYDDNPSCALATRAKAKRLGALSTLPLPPQGAWIIALGSLALRRSLIDRLAGSGAAIVAHPHAYVSTSASLRAGAFIAPGALVHSFAKIGEHAIINSGSIVEHECDIAENAHIAPGAVLGGNVRVGRDTLVGIGANVIPGVSIGSNCVIGAGAVVIADVPDNARVVGVPAEKLKLPMRHQIRD